MSAKRPRASFGMQHLTVVPRNADVASDADDGDSEPDERPEAA